MFDGGRGDLSVPEVRQGGERDAAVCVVPGWVHDVPDARALVDARLGVQNGVTVQAAVEPFDLAGNPGATGAQKDVAWDKIVHLDPGNLLSLHRTEEHLLYGHQGTIQYPQRLCPGDRVAEAGNRSLRTGAGSDPCAPSGAIGYC